MLRYCLCFSMLLVGLLVTGTFIGQAQLVNGKISVKLPQKTQIPAGTLSGTWLLAGQYYASGAPLPPTADVNANSDTITIVGENRGTIFEDEPMRFGDAKIQISCRGTITSNFTVSRIAGLTVLHETNVIETAGKACQQMAGHPTNIGDLVKVVEVSGDTLRTINGLADADKPTKAIDMAIYTYKRVQR